jgi:hypothetical protein
MLTPKQANKMKMQGKKIMFLSIGKGCIFRPFLGFQQLAHWPCHSQWVPQFQEGSKIDPFLIDTAHREIS